MFASIKMLAARIGGWFSRKRVDEDFEQELRAHLEMLTQENMQRGMTRKDAVRAAHVRLGGVTQLRETNREMWGLPIIEAFLQDVRYALRMLRKSPGFAAVAILTLALGIGANTAIFSVAQAIFLRALPVAHPEQIVSFSWDHSKWPRSLILSGYDNSLSYAAYQELRAKNSTFSSLFGFAPFGFNAVNTNVVANGQARLVDGVMVTGDFFPGLGILPALGRVIDEDDEGESKPRVAVLGYGYWITNFNSDVRVIGTTITVNNLPCTIIGVAPPEFHGVTTGRNFDIYVSLGDGIGLMPYGNDSKRNLLHDEIWHWLTVMGRLKSGVNPATAQTDVNFVFRNYLANSVLKGYTIDQSLFIKVSPAGKGFNVLRHSFADPIKLLEYMVGLILLMTCANLATLLMVRATNRAGEIGIRMAIGASRARVITQLLIENLMLAFLGAAFGVAFAQWGARAIVVLLSPGDNPLILDTHLDLRVLLFAAGLAIVTVILFGLGPSISATRVDVNSVLKDSSRGGAVRGGRTRIRGVLVCAQVAVSLVLLAAAGLFARTVQNLEHENLGFDRQQVLLFTVNPSQNGYDRTRLLNFCSELQSRIETIRGVSSASPAHLSLISGWIENGAVTGENATPGSNSGGVYSDAVGTHFFATMGMPLVLGRDFDQRDINSAAQAAVVNHAFAQRYWPNQNPLGRRFTFGDSFRPADSYEVIGVVQDGKFADVREKIRATVFYPFTQKRASLTFMHFAAKTSGDASASIPAIRRAVRAIDPTLPLYEVKTESQQIDESLSEEHTLASLSTFFAALALLLASIGLYGVLAYTVGQRTHEFGIRMALGAARGNILSLVMKSGLWLSGLGVMIGIGGALLSSGFLEKFLYGVKPKDPWTLLAAAVVLLAVALIACWIPARRATRVDPMIALRYE